jgi:hypothetical protein
MPTSTAITLAPSAARSASGSGASVDLGIKTALTIELLVSAASGTNPTLDVSIETSKDGVTWRTLGAFARVTALGALARSFAGADRYLRAVWALGGTTPGFTFSVAGAAFLVYSTPAQVFSFGVAAARLKNLDGSLLAEHIIANTDDVNDQLCKRFKLPLTAWPSSLSKHLAAITAWTALSSGVGVNPQTGDQDIRQRHDKAWKSIEDLAENRGGSTDGYVDSTPEVIDDGVYVWSRRRRR